MWIKRIQVEEGFLHGLDLEFDARLNVLIGARGTGKSSVLEIIRFALGSPSFTDQAEERGTSQARAVLGSGRVALTVEDEGEVFEFERSADDPLPTTLVDRRTLVTVLGQNELEAVAAQPIGRVRLLDRFIRPSSHPYLSTCIATAPKHTTKINTIGTTTGTTER